MRSHEIQEMTMRTPGYCTADIISIIQSPHRQVQFASLRVIHTPVKKDEFWPRFRQILAKYLGELEGQIFSNF